MVSRAGAGARGARVRALGAGLEPVSLPHASRGDGGAEATSSGHLGTLDKFLSTLSRETVRQGDTDMCMEIMELLVLNDSL